MPCSLEVEDVEVDLGSISSILLSCLFSLMFFWLVVGDVGCSRPIRVLHRWIDTMQDHHSNLDGEAVVVDAANHAILDVDSILLLDDDVLANFHLVDVVVAVVHVLDDELRLFSATMMFCLVLPTKCAC